MRATPVQPIGTVRGRLFVTVAVLVVGLAAAFAQEAAPAEEPAGIWEEILNLYERAKERGEDVPRDVYEWIRQDLQASGRWEYRVTEIDASGPEKLEKKLNDLGAERWECIWVEPAGKGKRIRLVLKRPVRSYLRQLPLVEMLKMVPVPDPTDGGP